MRPLARLLCFLQVSANVSVRELEGGASNASATELLRAYATASAAVCNKTELSAEWGCLLIEALAAIELGPSRF